MRKIKLTSQEKAIEDSLLKGEYFDVKEREFNEVAQAISSRRKDTVLNIRINSQDVRNIKQKAHQLGIKYQTFIAELLHKIAHAR